MKDQVLSKPGWFERVIVALLFIAIGGVTMTVFNPWGKHFLEHVPDYVGRIVLIALLFIGTVLVGRSERFKKYGQLSVGLLILAIVVSLDKIIGVYLIDYVGVSDATPIGWMLQKVNETLFIVCAVIFLQRASGGTLESLYIKKGNLKLGLAIGLITFILAAAGSMPAAEFFFKAKDLSLARVIPWIPIILVIVLANGTLEELLFRGVFLKRLEPFFGKFTANFIIALVFTVLHRGASYTSQEMMFLVILLPLALLWGYITQKTDGLWGSILFHAGMDIPIFLGIFSNLA
jgi:membrane protease YdiL (CAAX protease family)